jgi:hypothetical protein
MPALSPAERARNHLARLRARHAPPEEIAAAREALAEANLRARIADEIEKAPPLTASQRERLAAIFSAPGPLVPDDIRRAS